MSGSEVSEMDVDYQSEDGEIKIQKSPLDKGKQNEDILSFSLSEEDADDTADSLDIKPPQATALHSYKSRSHREKRSHRDKDRRTFGHSTHISRGDSLSGASSHKKSHHHSREHRERREERHREREKRHHRDKHPVSSESKRDRADYSADERLRDCSRSMHRDDGVYRSREDGHGSKSVVVERVSYSETRLRDARESREIREVRETREVREFRDHRESREPRESREVRDHRESRSREETRSESRSEGRAQEKVIEDLREQLIDKRRSDSDARDRTRDRDRRTRKRDRNEAERFLQQSQEQQPQQSQQPQQAAPQPVPQAEKEPEKQSQPVPKEPPLKKADKVERDMRRERLLEASREMDRQKEVYRRELEARRRRRCLEEEKERTLETIAKKRERSLSRERKRRRGEGDENMEEDDVEKGDSDDSVKEVRIEPKSKSPKAGDRSSDEEASDSSSEGTTEEGEESDTDSGGGRTVEHVSDDDHPRRNGTEDHDDHENDLVRTPSDTESEHSHPEENGKQASPAATPPPSPPPPSPPPPVDPFEGLPSYFPAIQGCRSVEEFQCLNRIEEGTYGVVYRARDKRTDEIVALKRLKMEKEKEGFPITSLREINTLLKAQHKNIVTVREIVVGSNMDKIFIVMDYVEHDLKSLMETMRHKKQAFSSGEVKCLMQQLLKAVNHLHDNWILHRDLKTSNLLLSHKGVLKVGDFGLAREYGSPLKAYTPIVVTLWYRSPELLLCTKEYSTPVDMWSVGCIYAEFLLMEALFPGKSEIDQLNRIFKELGTPNDRQWPGFSKMPAVQKMNFTDYPVNQLRNRFGAVSSEIGIDLLNKFLTYDPSKRITADDAQQHPYFKESPVAIHPAMFPTWPAKSELGHRKAAAASPKPPSGGKEYKQLGEGDEDVPMGDRFHMGGVGLERSRVAVGAGFSLKF